MESFLKSCKSMDDKICAIVTTFSPSERFLDNLSIIREQVDSIIVVDDSGGINIVDYSELDSLKVIYNLTNLGIAESLNVGIDRAIELGYTYILTMNDDSVLEENYVSTLFSYLCENSENTSLVIGTHDLRELGSDAVEKISVMTSGSLFCVHTYVAVGGFSTEMFIDYVDFDFCLRLKNKSGKIVMLSNAKYGHTIGAPGTKKVFGINFNYFDHQPFRVYYQSRNVIYMLRKHLLRYPLYITYMCRLILVLPFKVICFEENKILKLKMYLRGLADGLKGKTGKIDH